MFRRRSPTSSLVTFNDKWISLSLETTSELTDLIHIVDAPNINDDDIYNDDGCSRENTIIH